jgi:hypothetical protein
MTSQVGAFEVRTVITLPKPMTGPQLYVAVQAAITAAGNRELTPYGQNHETDESLAFFGQHSPHPNEQVAVKSLGDSAPYFSDDDECAYDSVAVTSHPWPIYCWREDEDPAAKLRAVQDFVKRFVAAIG